MTVDRRDFLRTSALGGAALASLHFSGDGVQARERFRAPRPATRELRLLILGGTSFLGPHLVRYALERGHSVSIFTRGQREPTIHTGLFANVEHLIGDRADDLTALAGRSWDAVIDNSGQRVEWTTASAELLRDRVDRYVYTSSTGVYLPYLGNDITEETEVLLEDAPEAQSDRGPSYGVMKSLSELEARRAFGDDRTIVVRPTYIVGPADPTNRFSYWPVRLERGGEVLVPGKAADPVQWIDVRDLTEWMIRLIEDGASGTFNGAGPASPMGMHAFVYGAHAAVASEVEWILVDDYDFLEENRLGFAIPWIAPLGDNVGSARINIDKSKASGLTFRPLADTARDVLDWWHSDAVTDERRQSLTEDPRSLMAREAGIIAAWKSRAGGAGYPSP